MNFPVVGPTHGTNKYFLIQSSDARSRARLAKLARDNPVYCVRANARLGCAEIKTFGNFA